MEHAISFIQDLAVIMLIAGVITVLFHRLKQPVVLGYIIAGIIIGPYTPPFMLIQDQATIKTLAELGVIFLLFSLGLEFDLQKLKKVGFAAAIAAFAEITLMIWLGYEIGLMFGWPPIDAIFLGAILAVSSTTIIVKALEELGLKHEGFAQLIFGILIIEDIFAIAILALLSGIAVSGSLQMTDVLMTTIKLLSFLVISLFLGILLIPRLLAYIFKFKNKEMLLISVLGLCFGFCLLVAKLDYSVALGAFVIGAIVAESRQLKVIERLINPLRDMFSAIFFVSIGLMFNPAILIDHALPIVIITVAVVIGKVLTCSLGMFLTGRDGKTAMRVGMGLAQIGEFSFIIASLGVTLNVTSHFLFPMAVMVSAITTFLTPYLIRYSDPITQGIYTIMPKRVTTFFGWYTTWLQNIKDREVKTKSKEIMHRNSIQVILNFFIVIAIFLSAVYIAMTPVGSMLTRIANLSLQKTIIWTAALMLSLPFLIAIYRKVKALSVILAERAVKERIHRRFTLKVRRVIAEVIPIIAVISILLFVSALSVTILPPVEWLIVISIIMLCLMIFLYSWFIKLYAKLQTKFFESMRKKEDSKK